MRYEALRYFVEIAEQGSINKAAESLYVSQPNLSTAIRNLEKDFHTILLERTNRGVQLTAKGKEIYQLAKRIFEQFDRLEQYNEMDESLLQVHLALSISGVFLCSKLLTSYPHMTDGVHVVFQLFESGLEQMLRDIANLNSNFGIATVDDTKLVAFKRIAEIDNLEYEEIGISPLVALLSKSNPLFDRDEITAEELLPFPMIRFEEDYFSDKNYHYKVGGCSFEDYKSSIEMNNYHSLITLLKNSNAFLMSNLWAASDLEEAGIRAVRIHGSTMKVRLMLVKRRQEILSCDANAFRQMLAEHYRSIPTGLDYK